MTPYGTIYVNPDFAFWIPNSFTPNGDGANEYFSPKGYGFDKNSYEMLIFERWGKEMFKTNNINIGWNGTFENKYPFEKAVEGVYVYLIDVSELNGKSHTFRGRIFLIK